MSKKHEHRIMLSGLMAVIAMPVGAHAQQETFDLSGRRVQFIEGDTPAPAVPAGDDAVIFDCVVSQGGTISNIGDDEDIASEIISGNDLILISNTVGSGSIQSSPEYVESATPIINWEPALTDYFAIVGTLTNGDTTEGPDWSGNSIGPCIEIVNVSHPITQGLQPGLYNVYTQPVAGGMNDYATGLLAPGATLLAQTEAGRATFFAMDVGATDNDGLPYARRHVELFINDPAAGFLTDLGKTLINRSIAWAMGIPLQPIANPPAPGCEIVPLSLPPLPAVAYVEEIADHPDGEANPPAEQGALAVRRAVDGTVVFELQERFNFNRPNRTNSQILAGSFGQPRTGNEVDTNFGIHVTQEGVTWRHILDTDPNTAGHQVPADISAFTLVILGEDLEGNQEAGNDFRYEVLLDGLEVDPDPLSPEGRWDTRPTVASQPGVFFARTFTLADNPDHIAAAMDGEIVVELVVAGFIDPEFNTPAPGDHTFFSSTLLVGQEPIESIQLAPGSGVINVGNTIQLRALANTAAGGVIPVTSRSTLESDTLPVATVDAAGVVTALGPGLARITATFDDPVSGTTFTAISLIEVGDFIDLGDIASAGDGKGNKLPVFDEISQQFGPVIGVDQDFGRFEALRFQQAVGDLNGVNPTVMNGQDAAGEFTDDSPWIDSVFVMNFDNIAINSSGVRFDFEPGDSNTPGGWEFILDGLEPGGPEFLQLNAYESNDGLGIHASAGLTFDLDALRSTHGPDAVQFFSAGAGELTSDTDGTVNNYVIFSDTNSIISSVRLGPHNDSGEIVEVAIPANARFLTLAVGDANDGIGSDHGGFVDAFISRDSIGAAISSFVLDAPAEINLIPDRTEQVAVRGAFGTRGNLGINLAGDPRVSFDSSNSGIVTVDDTGLITAVAAGSATVTGLFDGAPVGSVPVTVIDIGGGEAVTITVQVAAGNDDAEEHITEGNTIDLGSSDLELGAEGGGSDVQHIGIRFLNVDIPPGATVQNASVQFTVDETDDESTSLRIFGELTPDAATFSSAIADISSRPRTAAFVDWNDIPVWSVVGEAGPDQQTPDLASVVQEIVDQAGWSAGNSLVVLIEPNPGGERTAESFNGSASQAPILSVTWSLEPEPDIAFDFDTSGPTTTGEILSFFDLLGFEPVTGTNWTIDPNTVNPDDGSNALHTVSNGNELTNYFSRVAVLQASHFEATDVEVAADITWDDNDNAGLYARFVDEQNYYFLRAVGDGAGTMALHKVKDGTHTQVVATSSPVPIPQGATRRLSLRVEGNAAVIFATVDGIPVPGIDPFIDGDPVVGVGRIGVGQETNPTFFDNLTARALTTLGDAPVFVSIMDGLGASAEAFISPLGEDVALTQFGLTTDVPLDSINVAGSAYTAGGTAPTVASFVSNGDGTHAVTLDSAVTPGHWLRLDLEVAGADTASASFSVWLAHQPLDVNQDGQTSIRDATAFGDVFRGSGEPQLININGDGSVNVRDATAFGNNWNGIAPFQAWRNTALPARP